MRVGFLFNHYAAHQVPHAAPYAFELSRRRPEFEVVVACSTEAEMAMAKAIGSLYPGHRCTFESLRPAFGYRLLDPVLSRWQFRRKRWILEQNLPFFRSLDALVTPERHSLKLRTDYGLGGLKIIHTRHGAGDREGGFDERCAAFDFTLLPGRKYVDRLRAAGHLRDGAYAVVGWPKFEVVRRLNPAPKRLFDNDRPTVVYAPHFDQRVSSWQTMGRSVLAFFARRDDYNLIVAPHVVLFMRRRRHGAYLPGGYARHHHILIDTGSVASTDMTYMRAADIYLGDVSSQVYEFLLEPRPCIFLNAPGIAWRGDRHYDHFALGQVVDDVETGLGRALDQAFSSHPAFLPKQRAAIDYTFHRETGSSAAERGADALATFLLGGEAAAALPDPPGETSRSPGERRR